MYILPTNREKKRREDRQGCLILTGKCLCQIRRTMVMTWTNSEKKVNALGNNSRTNLECRACISWRSVSSRPKLQWDCPKTRPTRPGTRNRRSIRGDHKGDRKSTTSDRRVPSLDPRDGVQENTIWRENARWRNRRPRYKATVHVPDFDTLVLDFWNPWALCYCHIWSYRSCFKKNFPL